MFRFCYIISFVFLRLLFPCKVIGKKNFLKKQGQIVVCNHLSNLDPIYLLEYLPRQHVLAKKEIFKNKFVSWWLKKMGIISVDRGNNDITAIKNSLKVLKENKSLLIFPEGTRNKTSTELQPIKTGTAMFAIKAKVPILPVHIEKRGKIFRFNKIVVGKPFELNEFYGQKLDDEILKNATNIIFEKLKNVENCKK